MFRAIMLLCAAAFSSALAAQFTTFDFAGTGAGPIPDGTAAPPPAFGSPLTISFSVSGLPLNVRSVGLSMDITHTWVGDVEAVLAAPGGSPSIVLFSRVGATSLNDFGDDSDLNGAYGFLDNATGDLWADANAAGPTTVIPAPGFYRTSTAGGTATGGTITSLDSVFRGLTSAQANGVWTLTIRDAASSDTGSVSWATLSLNCGPWITSIAPSSGPTAGGTSVTVAGDGFVSGNTTVEVDGAVVSATVSQTSLQFTTPAHAFGPVNVKVTTPYGEYTQIAGYLYFDDPSGGGGGDGDDAGCSTGPGTSPLFGWVVLAICLLFAIHCVAKGRDPSQLA